MTFPLMSAGVLRLAPGQPGRTLSLLYFANSLGAAVGVLVAGFYLVEAAGLPGTLAAAAALNLAVAAATLGAIVVGRTRRGRGGDRAARTGGGVRNGLGRSASPAAVRKLRAPRWPRSSTRSPGSACWPWCWAAPRTSFELMLSAFILGLALGAWWIRTRADRVDRPGAHPGHRAVDHGRARARDPSPLHPLLRVDRRPDRHLRPDRRGVHRIHADALRPVPRDHASGDLLCRHDAAAHHRASCSALRSGERAIGAVYAWNTLGSIAGRDRSPGLVLLPAIGLHALLIAGALVDMAVGVVLLRRAGAGRARRAPGAGGRGRDARRGVAGLGRGALRPGAALERSLPDRRLVQAGRAGGALLPRWAHRHGDRAPSSGATASSTWPPTERPMPRFPPIGLRDAMPHGRPSRWLRTAPPRCCSRSSRWPTRRPRRSAAVIGQGSRDVLAPHAGQSGDPGSRHHRDRAPDGGRLAHLLSGQPARVRRPALAPRDRRREVLLRLGVPAVRHDHVRAVEPMGERRVGAVYHRVLRAGADLPVSTDGVFGQWLHVYELDDELVLSVHRRAAPELPLLRDLPGPERRPAGGGEQPPRSCRHPTGRCSASRRCARTCAVSGRSTRRRCDALHLAGRRGARAAARIRARQPNSDFFPVLDLGAERRRFRHDFAVGFPALSADWFNLLASMRGRPVPPRRPTPCPCPENPRVRARAIGALLRTAAAEGRTDTIASPAAAQARVSVAAVAARARTGRRATGRCGSIR